MFDVAVGSELFCVRTSPQEMLDQRIVFLSHEDTAPSMIEKVTAQPMMKDGAARLWSFNPGLDATKDPPRRVTPIRMKASMDEKHMKDAVTMVATCMTDADTAVFLTGRNALIEKDIRKELLSIKPKLSVKQLAMEPDSEQYLQVIRIDSNRAGTVDPREIYYQVTKSQQGRKKKGTSRRFVTGNTAFKTMSHLPVLRKAAMVKVPRGG